MVPASLPSPADPLKLEYLWLTAHRKQQISPQSQVGVAVGDMVLDKKFVYSCLLFLCLEYNFPLAP